ncbi:MAG: VWA domain-containing protein [Halothiobacillus sp.]
MEEQVGIAWHQILNRLTMRRYPDAAVELSSISSQVGMLFRALGGDHGVVIHAGEQILNHSRRNILERLSGNARKVDLAWVDNQALRLPLAIDAFPTQSLNSDLYLWLAALSAIPMPQMHTWFTRNQVATLVVIRRFPGLAANYRRLVGAEILRRGQISKLAPDEARQEQAIRDALREPGSILELPKARKPPHPVLLWLRPEFKAIGNSAPNIPDRPPSTASTSQSDKKRRMAEYTEMPERKGGLLLFRPESIFSWAEYAKIEHEAKENEDEDLAQAADDLDMISITRDHNNIAKKINMTLDLPRADTAQFPLENGKILPEWDFKTHTLKPNQCRVNLVPMTDNEPCVLPIHLKRDQQRLRRQFSALQPMRLRLKAQPDGNDIDIDSYIRHIAHHHGGADTRFYLDQRKRERDLSCLLLADFSLSTEAWVGDEQRVIDVIRDSLFLFSETLSMTQDNFALYGFNSKQRSDVRFHTLKAFNEPYSDAVRGRINSISPAYYTRMGAAIRHTTDILCGQKTRERLLLLLTDGKPNDSDHYEGRYGIEDTRKAIIAARQQGLRPFCVTVDQEANEYLPHIFGKHGFIIIQRPTELPTKLPLLYSLITR